MFLSASDLLHLCLVKSSPHGLITYLSLSNLCLNLETWQEAIFKCSYTFKLNKPRFLRGAFTVQTCVCQPRIHRAAWMLREGERLWVTHELCADWLEDMLVWCVPDHQSKRFDRLAHHASSVRFRFPLDIYLFVLRQMIATMAKAHLIHILSFVFASWYKCHPFILQMGQWCCNSALHFQSAQRVGDYTSHQHVVGFWTPFFSQDKSLPSNALHTFFFFF